jgi:hypothetical protein
VYSLRCRQEGAGKGDETGPPRPIFKKLVYKYAIKLKMVGTLVRFCPKKA